MLADAKTLPYATIIGKKPTYSMSEMDFEQGVAVGLQQTNARLRMRTDHGQL